MTALALVYLGLSLVGARLARIAVSPEELASRAGSWCLLLVGFAFFRWRKFDRVANFQVIAFWSLVFSNLYLIPVHIVARFPTDFHDRLLARADRALGLEVPEVLAFMKDYPRLNQFLDGCYHLLLPLIVLAIVLPPLCGHMRRAKEYIVAGSVAVLITLPLFAVFQAEGPWSRYGYPPRPDQQKYIATLSYLKTDQWFDLHLEQTEGLITFPSFHAVLAVLAAFALRPIRCVRWPAAVLAGLIVVSTVTTGWHYVADVVAGVLIAAAACAAAKGFTRLEARADKGVAASL
jgi:membrane-associated phospholipid phosphatase